MQEWSSKSYYKFGSCVRFENGHFFCLSGRTSSVPSDASDWVKIDKILDKLPESSDFKGCVLVNNELFSYDGGWINVSSKKNEEIVFSNRDPESSDSGLFWINEIENSIFKMTEGWEMVNCGDEDIFEYPFSPSREDDECDSSGNGMIIEGSFWINSKTKTIFQNLDPAFLKSVWKRV